MGLWYFVRLVRFLERTLEALGVESVFEILEIREILEVLEVFEMDFEIDFFLCLKGLGFDFWELVVRDWEISM